jgi:hypothetical protein
MMFDQPKVLTGKQKKTEKKHHFQICIIDK